FIYEGNGKDWNFLIPSHPIVISSFIFFVGSSLIFMTFIISKYWNKRRHNLKLKWAGKKTIGQIIKIKDTRIRVNNRPLMAFEIEFTDHQGIKYLTKYRKVITVDKKHQIYMSTIPIFYLPEKPQTIVFEEDLLD